MPYKMKLSKPMTKREIEAFDIVMNPPENIGDLALRNARETMRRYVKKCERHNEKIESRDGVLMARAKQGYREIVRMFARYGGPQTSLEREVFGSLEKSLEELTAIESRKSK